MTQTLLAKDRFNHSVQCLKPSTTQTISFNAAGGASVATSNALAAGTVVVRLLSTADCMVAIGTGTPTAAATSMPLGFGVAEYFRVDDTSAALKVAALGMGTATGTLYVTEMS